MAKKSIKTSPRTGARFEVIRLTSIEVSGLHENQRLTGKISQVKGLQQIAGVRWLFEGKELGKNSML